MKMGLDNFWLGSGIRIYRHMERHSTPLAEGIRPFICPFSPAIIWTDFRI